MSTLSSHSGCSTIKVFCMASQMEAQFAGGETVLTEPNTVAFVQGKDLGPGLLNIDEK